MLTKFKIYRTKVFRYLDKKQDYKYRYKNLNLVTLQNHKPYADSIFLHTITSNNFNSLYILSLFRLNVPARHLKQTEFMHYRTARINPF